MPCVGSPLQATDDDVQYAYRLLLGREPDNAGYRGICDWVRKGSVGTLELARNFMMSAEFRAAQGFGGGLREVDLDGVKLFPWQGDTLIGDHVSADGAYEPNVLPLFLDSLAAGDHVLDVGANVGIFSLQAAYRVGPTGHVYAIEPVPTNVRSLCAGIHGNGFGNVSLMPVAASDRASVVAVLRHADSSNGIVDFNAGVSGDLDFVPTQRLDFLLHGIPRLDVVKIDIEGHEPMAWHGLKALVLQHRPRIFSEFSPVAIRNHCRVEPESYLDELFAVATQPIEVLARDGRRIRCKDTASVMQEWKLANKAMGMNGELHLDLLIETRRKAAP